MSEFKVIVDIANTVRHFRSELEYERRQSERFDCELDATTHSVNDQNSLVWGASVRNISRTGIGLTVCFPFSPGTALALDLHGPNREKHATFFSRVINVRDQNDGSWHVGCQLLEAFSEGEVESLLN
jgi:hypothetical protein